MVASAGTCRRSLSRYEPPLTLFDPVPDRVMLDAYVRVIAALGISWNLKKSVLVYHGHSKSSTSNLKVFCFA